jgi:hypothetical protein
MTPSKTNRFHASKEIAEKFGERVAGLVMEATDDKSLPKAERKRLQIETAPKKSRDAKAAQVGGQDLEPAFNRSQPPSSLEP